VRLLIIAFTFFGLAACTVNKESKTTLDKLKVRDSIKDSLRQVLRDSIINSSGVGDAGLETPEYRRVSWIIKTSDNEELKEFTRSGNAFIKAIGLKGLFVKRDKDWFDYLVPMLRDTGEYVAYQEGCFRYDYRLPEYCLLEVLRYEHMVGILTKEQTDKIDGLIKNYKIKVIPKQTATNNVFASSGVDA
jgi:hypothetical protein